jgi:hypothetical protein
VAALLAVIVALSAYDLSRTLDHMARSTMVEANPIARWIMAWESPALLVAWKTASVCVTVSMLLVLRRRATGELGALVAAAVLVCLTAHWLRYEAEVGRLTADRWAVARAGN